ISSRYASIGRGTAASSTGCDDTSSGCVAPSAASAPPVLPPSGLLLLLLLPAAPLSPGEPAAVASAAMATEMPSSRPSSSCSFFAVAAEFSSRYSFSNAWKVGPWKWSRG
ncbi:unnamed protein product, partial [Ectocarpus sp. 8 AP-2014]